MGEGWGEGQSTTRFPQPSCHTRTPSKITLRRGGSQTLPWSAARPNPIFTTPPRRIFRRPSRYLRRSFLAHKFPASLHDSHADDQDANGPEEQYDVADNGDSVQVYAGHVLGNHQNDEADQTC